MSSAEGPYSEATGLVGGFPSHTQSRPHVLVLFSQLLPAVVGRAVRLALPGAPRVVAVDVHVLLLVRAAGRCSCVTVVSV